VKAGSFHVDESRWPIVVYTLEGVLDDAELEGYVEHGRRTLARGEPYVVVIDGSRVGPVSAYGRFRGVQFSKENNDKLRTLCKGSAIVITSPLLRFIAMTMWVIAPMPMPYAVCATLEEALEWAQARLKK
jgi:hypothetical protein